MKVSVIIAVYKDVEALNLIFESLARQTYREFEVIVAEDGMDEQMAQCVVDAREKYDFEIKHTTQKDKGIRKLRSLNNGILETTGEYFIFIDGDCVPYSTFIEAHVFLAEEGYIVTGRRVNLGARYSKMLREKKLSSYKLEKTFLLQFFFIVIDSKEGHIEEGVYIKPGGVLYSLFFKNRKQNKNLLGCNYSCFREDMLKINGYDEEYGESPLGDDTDIQWRFETLGLKLKSCRNMANVFHLFHDRNFRKEVKVRGEIEYFKRNKQEGRFRCEQGLTSH